MSRVSPTAYVDPGAEIAADCAIEDSSYVGHGCILGSGCRVGARATITCDGSGIARTFLGAGASVGVAAVIAGPVKIGPGAVIRAGAVVLSDVPAYAIVEGNPAAVVGYTTAATGGDVELVSTPSEPLESVDVCGASLIRLPEFHDLRGNLTVIEEHAGLPFRPARVFLTYDVANREIRGSHAHRTLHEVLILVGGSATVVVDDGAHRKQVRLDHPSVALSCPPMLWLTQYDYSPDATLVVLASDIYRDSDYIRDYNEFLEAVRG